MIGMDDALSDLHYGVARYHALGKTYAGNSARCGKEVIEKSGKS